MENVNYFFKNPTNSIEVFILFLITILIFTERGRHINVTIAEFGIVWSIWVLLFIDVGGLISSDTFKINEPSTKSKNNIEHYNVVARFEHLINNLIYRDKPFDKNDININEQKLANGKYYIVIDRSKSFETNHSDLLKQELFELRNKLINHLIANCNTITSEQTNNLLIGDILLLNTLVLLKKNASSGQQVNALIYWGTDINGNPNFTSISDDFIANNNCDLVWATLNILKKDESNKAWISDYSHIMDKIKSNCDGKKDISLIVIGDFEHEDTKTLTRLAAQGEEAFFRDLMAIKFVYLPSKKNELSTDCFKVLNDHFANKFSLHNYEKVEIKNLVSVNDFMSKIARTFVKNISETESNEIVFYYNIRESDDSTENSNFVSTSVTFRCSKESPPKLYLTLHNIDDLNGNISDEDDGPKGISLINNKATEIELNDRKPEKNKWFIYFPKSQINDSKKVYMDIYSRDKIWKMRIPLIFKLIPPEPVSVFLMLAATLVFSMITFTAFREAIKIYSQLIYFNQWSVSLVLFLLLYLYISCINKLWLLTPASYNVVWFFCMVTIVLPFFYCFPKAWNLLKVIYEKCF